MTTSPSTVTFSPSDARRLDVRVASGEALDVREFQVHERMNELFEISILALSDDPDVDLEAIAGQAMTFSVRANTGDHGSRSWTGLCRHVDQVGVEERGLSTYRLVLVPALWLLTQRKNHRMFQRESELDIARKLLGEWGIPTSEQLTGTYKKREYRVQYGEPDFTFLCRMLEDAGISFFFRTDGDETKLVLCDAPEQGAPRDPPIAFRDNPTVAAREHVTRVRVGRSIRPGKYTVRDHDCRRPPSFDLKGSVSTAGIEASLEQFDYRPGAFVCETDKGDPAPSGDDRGRFRSDDREAGAMAERRLHAERASARTITFETNTVDLGPGAVVSFLDHPKSELAPGKGFLVTACSLRGEINGKWQCTCEAAGAAAPYRPPVVTPKPKTCGVESATVVGPAGEEIHTDEMGRVRVHFHWDRESRMNERSSCWIQVSQPWGGSGFGGTNLPRIGQEVIVDFLSGDPDRPVITGRLYTGLQTTPYKLPDNKTQSGWRSRSSPDGGGDNYNELMFEDRKGRELLRMQAERDLNKLVKNDETVKIGHDRTKRVEHDDALSVGNNRVKLVEIDETVTIGHDRTKLVKNDESVTIGHDRTKVVQRDERSMIGHDRTKVVQNDEHSMIGHDRTKVVQNDESVTIGHDRTKLVKNDENVTIGKDRIKRVKNDENVTIGNDRIKRVKKDEHVTIGKNLVRTVMANARDFTGLNKNVVVGVSRATQVGMIDSTMVGTTHSVMIAPAGEAGPAGGATSCVMSDNKITSTVREGACVTIDGKKITLDTGDGAKIVLEGDKITLTAKTIEAKAEEVLTLESKGKATLVSTKSCGIASRKDGLYLLAQKELGVRSIKANTVIKGIKVKINCK